MMKKLKPLSQQTIVLTGATSGIGLATARLAAEHGARLVLAARNQEALEKVERDLRSTGASVVTCKTDVTSEEDVRRLASTAIEHFGGFDTWINNAAVSMYGNLTDEPLEDERQLFETNYWGTVHGSRVAIEHLRAHGGTLINVGSANADFPAPYQGTYSASKHAVKGYTDALRVELATQGAPVCVTLVKPSPINTPYPRHARNHMNTEPKLTPPVYEPEVAARTILFCAEHPRREVYVGGGGRLFATLGQIPVFGDLIVGGLSAKMQRSGDPPRSDHADSLYNAGEDLQERGDYQGRTMRSSTYTRASLHPLMTLGALVAAGLAARTLLRSRKGGTAKHLARRAMETKAVHRAGELLGRGKERIADVAHEMPKMAGKLQKAAQRNVPGA